MGSWATEGHDVIFEENSYPSSETLKHLEIQLHKAASSRIGLKEHFSYKTDEEPVLEEKYKKVKVRTKEVPLSIRRSSRVRKKPEYLLCYYRTHCRTVFSRCFSMLWRHLHQI